MSLIRYWERTNARQPAAAARARRARVTFSISTIVRPVRKATVRGAKLILHAVQAVAEARMHRAAIDAELYRNRYIYTSKNDDDLPIVGSAPAKQPAPSVSPRVVWRRATGAVVAISKRVFPVVFIFSIFAAVVAATIAIRLAIWLPLYWY